MMWDSAVGHTLTWNASIIRKKILYMCVCTYAAAGRRGILGSWLPNLRLISGFLGLGFGGNRGRKARSRTTVPAKFLGERSAMRTEYLMDMKFFARPKKKKGNRGRVGESFRESISSRRCTGKHSIHSSTLFRQERNVSYVGFVEFSISQLSPPWNSRFLLFRPVEFPLEKEEGKKFPGTERKLSLKPFPTKSKQARREGEVKNP